MANESDELNEFDSNDTNNLGPKKVVLENALTGLNEIERYINQLSDCPEGILDLLATLKGELEATPRREKKNSQH